jgi:hypothetical protein
MAKGDRIAVKGKINVSSYKAGEQNRYYTRVIADEVSIPAEEKGKGFRLCQSSGRKACGAGCMRKKLHLAMALLLLQTGIVPVYGEEGKADDPSFCACSGRSIAPMCRISIRSFSG